MSQSNAGEGVVSRGPANASSPATPGAAPAVRAKRRMPWQARVLLALLSRISHGSLSLRLPDGSERSFGAGEPHASMHIDDWAVFRDALSTGDIGFAEAYLRGEWRTHDLAALLRLLVENRNSLERAIYGGAIGGLFKRMRHLLNANTRGGSKRNIAAHYDLGNDFYALWLDGGMTYSSALFGGNHTRSLGEAQDAKVARILGTLGLPAGSRILEIGCGWGGFAQAAAQSGCHVTGLTLSREQLAWATNRLDRAGLAAGADLKLQDYRDERGTYDAVVSVEMYEAVGERWWPAYFDTIAASLRPGGRAMVQAITIDDALFERYRVGTDFIQQYVFPGGMLASPSRFRAEAARAGLAVRGELAFGPDYAETLRRWRAAFMGRLDEVRAQGFDARFIRLWEFYLAYCEAAFDSGCCDVYQFELQKESA